MRRTSDSSARATPPEIRAETARIWRKGWDCSQQDCCSSLADSGPHSQSLVCPAAARLSNLFFYCSWVRIQQGTRLNLAEGVGLLAAGLLLVPRGLGTTLPKPRVSSRCAAVEPLLLLFVGSNPARDSPEFGGRGGIRTHEHREVLPVFKTGPFNRSGTLPYCNYTSFHDRCIQPLATPPGVRLGAHATAKPGHGPALARQLVNRCPLARALAHAIQG